MPLVRIRRIHDDILPVDRDAIAQAQAILRHQLPGLAERDVAKLPDLLRDPVKYGFRHVLFAAEGARGRLRGFALMSRATDPPFAYLDFISTAPGRTGGGIGGALYERVRDEARMAGARWLFLESLPDAPALCRDPATRAENAARLRFYERFGARPLANTAYETPLSPDDDCPPYLVMDPLGGPPVLPRDTARTVVRAILEGKYGHKCPSAYVEMVVTSLRDDPIRLQPARIRRSLAPRPPARQPPPDQRILLAVNERHDIHHVRERGYVEAPVRVSSILKELEPTGLFLKVPARHFGEEHIRAVHDGRMVDWFRRACEGLPPGRSLYPYVFPIRNRTRTPDDLAIRAGYYCIDTFTPLNRNAWLAARGAVDCALTVARSLTEGRRLGYALVRPPGHHAEGSAFGGFCYFNSVAVAARWLGRLGPVAVLDVDYHHGNGTQEIFYGRRDVLTVSIHGHPHFAYPYFSGFEDERGEGEGKGFNLNIPLPEAVDGAAFLAALDQALRRIARFHPQFLVVALGLDTARSDPTGTWTLGYTDFHEVGRRIGALHLPTAVIQEGGYRVRSLGVNARHFFQGLWEGSR